MSQGKIHKFLRDTENINDDLPRRTGTVVLYTDSKGFSVGRHVNNQKPLEAGIVWRCREGLKTELGIEWFKDELHTLRENYARHGEIHIYFWLGTCDLTIKSGRYIFLSSTFRSYADRLIRRLNLLSNYCFRQNLPLTLLEIPIFSLREYNISVGHHFPHLFQDQDYHLRIEIERINEAIREINTSSHKVSPKFSLDLQRNRPSAGQTGRQYYTNYKLYRDGIHPKSDLARLWLRKLSIKVKRDCY